MMSGMKRWPWAWVNTGNIYHNSAHSPFCTFILKELVSTDGLVPSSVGIKYNIIVVPYLIGYWLDINDIIRYDNVLYEILLVSSLPHESLCYLFTLFDSLCSDMPVSIIYKFFIICSWYHYKFDRYCGTWTIRAWDHFALYSCWLRPKDLSYLFSVLFISLCFFLFSIFTFNNSTVMTMCWVGFICIRLVPDQDVHFFYTSSHLSALQKCALLFSIYF